MPRQDIINAIYTSAKDAFIQYAYMIFVTPYGKGYGCFAIQADETNPDNLNEPKVYSVSASFHAPITLQNQLLGTDKVKEFDKNKYRKIATQRLKKFKYVDVIMSTPYPKMPMILDAAIVEGIAMPSWAYKAYVSGGYYYTLRQDTLSWIQMIDDLDAYKPLFLQMNQVKDQIGLYDDDLATNTTTDTIDANNIKSN